MALEEVKEKVGLEGEEGEGEGGLWVDDDFPADVSVLPDGWWREGAGKGRGGGMVEWLRPGEILERKGVKGEPELFCDGYGFFDSFYFISFYFILFHFSFCFPLTNPLPLSQLRRRRCRPRSPWRLLAPRCSLCPRHHHLLNQRNVCSFSP